MSEAKVLIKRRRRSIGALTMLLGGLMAVSSLFFAATVASAHHPEFSASRLCDGSWSASADYVGGSEERLIILSGVTINGVPLSAGQTNGFTSYDPGTHGVTDPPASGLAWKGTSSGFNLFSLTGSHFSGGWSGSITVYRPIGDVWFVGHGTSVYTPGGPTDCATSTPTATNTVPPTATATATVVQDNTPTVPSNTATPTKTTPANTPTVPANTPTPTKTVPPCTPPGTQTPTGGVSCTPTPTKTVPPTSTPTTPPCTPPGTQTPTGGSSCTPTPPPSTATPTTPASTATPTNPPAATNTPPAGCYNGGGTPPSGAVVCTPTPVDSVAGVRTPGAGPGVPSAGTGFTGDLSSTNMVFALLGLLAVTAGAAFMAMGRTADDE